MSKTKHIIAKVNADFKHEFKKVCLDNKESQKEAVNRALRHYVDTNGNLTEKK